VALTVDRGNSSLVTAAQVSDDAVRQLNSSDFMDFLTLYVLKFNTLRFRESIGARLSSLLLPKQTSLHT
jgi:hypothetical protein